MAQGIKAAKTKTPKSMKSGKPKMAGMGKSADKPKSGGGGGAMSARVDKLEKMHKMMKKSHTKAMNEMLTRVHALDGKGGPVPKKESAEAAEPEMHEGE